MLNNYPNAECNSIMNGALFLLLPYGIIFPAWPIIGWGGIYVLDILSCNDFMLPLR
jgi:hypothetical protein